MSGYALTRRRVVALATQGLSAVALGATPAQRSACDALRGERIRWLVGWSPGGGYDIYSRLMEPTLEEQIGAQIVVENVPGAAGAVAARQISRARPDGRTIGILNGTGLTIAPLTNPRYAPDLATDFTILGGIVDHGQTLVVGLETGINSVEDLRRMAGQRPLIIGETGPATVNVLLSVVTGDLLGVEVRLVMGFPGTQELLAAVMRGDVDAAVMAQESVGAARVRRLVRLGREREGATEMEGVPHLFGAGGLLDTAPELFPDLERARLDGAALRQIMAVGRLVAGPPGMDPAVRECLTSGVAATLADSAFQARAKRAKRTIAPLGPEAVLRNIVAAQPHVGRFKDRVDAAMARVRG